MGIPAMVFFLVNTFNLSSNKNPTYYLLLVFSVQNCHLFWWKCASKIVQSIEKVADLHRHPPDHGQQFQECNVLSILYQKTGFWLKSWVKLFQTNSDLSPLQEQTHTCMSFIVQYKFSQNETQNWFSSNKSLFFMLKKKLDDRQKNQKTKNKECKHFEL